MGQFRRRGLRDVTGAAVAFGVAALIAAACGSSSTVTVEDASVIVDDAPPVGDPPAPTPTPAPAPAPAPTATSEPPQELRPPALGVDDELFPALGSADLDVASYVVRLDASDPTGEIDGTVIIDTEVATDLDAIALDSNGPAISSVAVDGHDVSFELVGPELLIETTPDLVEDGEAVISIDFSFEADVTGPSSVGLPIGWIPAEGGAFVLNEPDGASLWLPSNDHPSDKATWRFEITASDGHVASANGALLEQPGDDGGGEWVWEELVPMPTYLVHLVVGPYELIEGEPVTSVDGDTIPLTHLVPSGDRDRFADDIEPTAAQIAFFEELFGPYPLDRYGLAFVRGLSGLAMETQGRSLYGASDFDGPDVGFIQHLLLAHELAHQWFGNAVSPATWDALWLNESLTTYAQWLWLDDIGLQPLESWAAEQLDRRVAGSVDATGDPTLSNLFGFERYDGGAVVVHALRRTVGDDAFFEILRRWVAENSGTSRSTDDFIALAEDVHDADLTDFFEDWLFAVVPPAEYPA